MGFPVSSLWGGPILPMVTLRGSNAGLLILLTQGLRLVDALLEAGLPLPLAALSGVNCLALLLCAEAVVVVVVVVVVIGEVALAAADNCPESMASWRASKLTDNLRILSAAPVWTSLEEDEVCCKGGIFWGTRGEIGVAGFVQ